MLNPAGPEHPPLTEPAATKSASVAHLPFPSLSRGGVGGDGLLIGIATYNERENLAGLIAAIGSFVPHAHVLVIDDASPDGTGALADELARRDHRVHVLHRAGKLGLGSAIISGMRYAIEHGFGRYVSMDADWSHDPKYLPAVTDLSGGQDVMIGSRYVPGGGVENWPFSRYLISRSVNLLTRILLGIPARDASGGFRCYRTELLGRIDLGQLWSKGYSFQEEMLFRALRADARIGETPIVFADRRVGASKANVREMVRSLAVLLKLAASRWVWPESLAR
jgi:dolichol-phosphate mannosyltransferase